MDGENKKYVTSIEQNSLGYGRFYLHTSDTLLTDVVDSQEAEVKAFTAHLKIQIHGNTDGNTLLKGCSVDGSVVSKQSS